MKNILILLFYFCLCSSSVFAKEKIRYIKVKTVMQENQTLGEAFRVFVREDSFIRKNSPMTQKTFEANPHIKDWLNLKPDTPITLYINEKFLDEKKLADFKNELEKKKQIKLAEQKKKVKLKQPKLYGASFTYGQVSIKTAANETLDMNFIKAGLSYKNILKKDYRYNIDLSTVKFSNLSYSDATEDQDSKDFLPEFELGITKKLPKNFSLGTSFSYLNYFVVGTTQTKVTLSPKEIYRLNLKPSYFINEKFTLISSLGYLEGAGSGFDFSFGANYKFKFQNKLDFHVNFVLYQAQLSVENRDETSNAMALSLSSQF